MLYQIYVFFYWLNFILVSFVEQFFSKGKKFLKTNIYTTWLLKLSKLVKDKS